MYEFAALALVPVLQDSAASAESGLPAFVGLTGLVITGFLVLARLSQRVVDDADASADVSANPGSDANPTGGDASGRSDDAEQRPDAAFGGRVAPAPTDFDADPYEGASRGDHTADRPGDDGDDAGGASDRLAPEESVSADRFAPDADTELSPGALLANVALTQGLFGAVLVGGAVYFGVPGDALGLAATETSTGLPAVAVGIAFGVVLWVGNELATGAADAAGAGYDEGLREMLAPASAGGWALLLGVTLPIIAVVEEFIFRAAAVGATTSAFSTSPWALAVVSSVAFALGHGAQGRVGVVVTGGLGFALAAAFVLTNSLLVVVIAHYLVNALEFAVHEGVGASDPVWG